MERITKRYEHHSKKNIIVEEPKTSKYNYMYERTKNNMNDTILTFNNKKITAEELHEKIHEMVRKLKNKGIGKGDIIGVCLENTPEAVYLVYALDIIGAKRVGLSIFNNPYKMKRDIEMLKPKMIISTKRMLENVKNPCNALEISAKLYTIDDINRLSFNNKNEIEINQNIDDITDIVFTGGSSGIHKAVALNGNGLNSVIKSLDYVFDLEPGMIHLGNIPFGHMVFGMFALHYSLCNNLEYALTLESLPNKFLDEIIRTKANGIIGGPVHYEYIHNNPLLKPGCLSSVVQAASGGEQLKMETYKNAEADFRYGGSSAGITNMLGLTEMSGLTHACVYKKNTEGTLGYPILFVDDMIVDVKDIENINNGKAELKEISPGKTGLLLTRGPSMMLGYYDNPEETNKVFIYDQYGNKWYNTGDLACRAGYNYEETKFSGRIKRNFVCNYDNIYPEQIEELLVTIPEINEAVITKVPDDKFQFLPVYHICVNDNNCDFNILKDKIDSLIENTLGQNALPGYIEFSYDLFPRTENQKINVRLLQKEDDEKYSNHKMQYVRKYTK